MSGQDSASEIEPTESTNEIARANREKWIAVQKAIGLTEKTGEFLHKVIGPPAEALGGLLGDQLKSWRAANLDQIARKWQKIREERGIAQEAVLEIPFGDAYRTIEAASIEEDPNVQDLWAKLIASATDSSRFVGIKKVYVDILKSLSSNDALLLSIFFDHASSVPVMILDENHKQIVRNFVSRIRERVSDLDNKDIVSSMENLVRLRILSLTVSYPQIFGEIKSKDTIYDHVRKMKKNEIADALVELVDAVNIVAGWANHEAIHEMNAENVVHYGLNYYTLTPLGFDMLGAVNSE